MDNLSNKFLLQVLISVMLIMGFASQAYAVGTAAGTSVNNQATVTFSVGGVQQTPVTSDDPSVGGTNDVTTFTVDTKIDVEVAWQDAANVQVAAGQDGATPVPNPPAVLEFLITNEGNATTQDFNLSVADDGADDFDPTAYTFYLDDGDGSFDAGDTVVTFIDELSSTVGSNTVTIFVVGTIAASQTNGQTANVSLIATAHDGGAGGLGSLSTQDTGNDVQGGPAQNVFADDAGTAPGDTGLVPAPGTSTAPDGRHSDQGTYVVIATTITVTKASRVEVDGIGGTFPTAKAIPGATVRYTFTIANSGSQNATNITITDALDTTNLNFPFPGTGGITPGTVDVTGCAGATPSFVSPNLSIAVTTIASSGTCTVQVYVGIN